ncbi:unnamed protein product [Discula destructiva]
MASLRLSLTAIAVSLNLADAQDRPLLSTIATIPELSTFSAVVNGSGGFQLNPALEERFNSALDRRNYTGFIPTNDAFAKISPGLVGALTAAPAYPLLEGIIRTHIAEGMFTSTDIVSASPIEAIEGFPLTFQAAGSAFLVNSQAEIMAANTPASNGMVHQIDQLLNPFTAYFGISNCTAAPRTSETGDTMADILLNDPRLSSIREVFLALQPDFINNRLNFPAINGDTAQKQQRPTIFAAPSNTAFEAAPPGTVVAAKSPSNQDLSFQLFSFGLVQDAAKLADLDFAAGNVAMPNAFTGINITTFQAASCGAEAVCMNNAVIEEEVCGSNGCVWLVDRILDPLYLSFGPLNRTI